MAEAEKTVSSIEDNGNVRIPRSRSTESTVASTGGKLKHLFHRAHKKSLSKKENEEKRIKGASVLVSAITAGDIGRSRQIINLVSLRDLNQLVRIPVKEEMFQVTPLLWAVIHSQVEIVKLLIAKGVNIDRQGYLDNGSVTHTYTPLTKALDNCDKTVVKILLEAGADPYLRVAGPKISEEEGSVVRYTTWLYPVNKAIETDDVEIVRMFMERFDPRTVYSNCNHTCLCFASRPKRKLNNWFDINKCIISYGGKICDGTGEDSVYGQDGMCHQVYLLLKTAVKITNYYDEKSHFECRFDRFKILALVCDTDYVRENSSITKALHWYFKGHPKDRFKYGRCSFVCQRSSECYYNMMNYSKTPTQLKQICRVVIRNSVKHWHPDKCSLLPLPSKLQKFVGYMDEY